MEAFKVRPLDPEATFSSLSGGNQQRAILARWMRHGARVLVLDEPTQGVDIGGRADIYSAIVEAARRGSAVIVASSDVDELVGLCDRVLVLRNSRIAAELRQGAMTSHAISLNALV
jgi:ribose transport system ATP-binding protein